MPTERVIDLRGRGPSVAVDPVLADPSGRRARRLRAAGRLVGVLFLLWLGGLALAGLGLLPAERLPLGEAVHPAQAPPPLAATPLPRRTPVADLRPARPLVVAARPRVVPPRVATAERRVAAAPRRASAPAPPVRARRRKPTVVATTPAAPAATPAVSPRPAAPPARGKTGTSPGQQRKAAAAAPPATTTTTTPPGKSGAAPGHDPDAEHGHAPKN